jgi:hypothetical protein
MKRKIFLPLLALILLAACNSSETYQDENISQSIRDEIAVLDQKIIDAVVSNDIDLILNLSSDDLLSEKKDSFVNLITQVSPYIQSNEFEILNQFYITNFSSGNDCLLQSGTDTTKDYRFIFTANNKETYVSLLKLKDGYNDILLSIVYGKYGDEWKINILYFGLFAIHGKTANDYLTSAKEKYDNGHLMDAFMDMMICMEIIYPGGDYLLYLSETEMHKFTNKIVDAIEKTMSFPLPLSELETKPQIVSIYPQIIDEGIFPMIEYFTEVNIDDTIQGKIENDKIHSVIGNYINGITDNKKYVFYKAFNEMPDGEKVLPFYGYVQEAE